jgi:hypothetical protein
MMQKEHSHMKTKKRFARFAAALLAVAVLFCPPSRISAQRGPDPIVGTWELSIAGGPPGNIGFVIIHADGTVAETSLEDVVSPPVSSPGYGLWAHTQASNYTLSFKFFLVGPGPEGYCTAKVRQSVTLTSPDQWSGPGHLDCFDAGGNALFGFDTSVTANRMHLEPLG